MERNCFKTYKVENHVDEITLIGCGGTGGFLAELLARMIKGFDLPIQLVLYDGDRVNRGNVVRQNFHPCEIGQNKAEVLATRISGQVGIPIVSKAVHCDGPFFGFNNLVITATDNLASRRKIAKTSYQHWIDVGNELTFGQAIYGHTHDNEELHRCFEKFKQLHDHQLALPSAAALNPAILKGREKRKTDRGCVSMPFSQQGFGINIFAASAAALLAKQIVVDRMVKYHAVYFNLESGWMRPRLIDRELFRRWK